jgi:uncharacterized protein YecT (DUF1311 family)
MHDMRLQSLGLCVLLFLSPPAAAAKDAQDIIDGCWSEGAHPAMAACVDRHAQTARQHLDKAERAIRKVVTAETSKHLEASIASFHAYRRAACAFRESVARTSNAIDAIKAACEAELDERRALALEADKVWLE